MLADKPFDRRLRRLRRRRAAARIASADYLHRRAADELIGRLEAVRREFADALVLGHLDDYLSGRLHTRGLNVVTADARWGADVQCDEDMLPFRDGAFDLILSIGALDSVNDLPGALVLIRRALKPDGLFLAALAGAGGLPQLRGAMLAADESLGDSVAPRLHPQIDVRAAGDLLARAGFHLPVADSESVTVRFRGMPTLVADLRAMAATNLLASRSRAPLLRAGFAAATARFAASADADGKVTERLELLYLTGWAPPAR